MKISIAHDKKIIKREQKTVPVVKVAAPARARSANGVAALSAVADESEQTTTVDVETNVLTIGDYGVFKVKDGDDTKTVEGRIIEISDESSEDKKVLIFRVDISTEYNSALTDIISYDILNWTKAGEETIGIDELLKYSYEDDKSLVVDTGSSTIVIRVNDIITVTNNKTGESKKGRVSAILNNQVTIDCSSKGYSDVYVLVPEVYSSEDISITVNNN